MSFAIARIMKLKKTGRTLVGSSKHNHREINVPNSDPEKRLQNQILIGDNRPKLAWKKYLQDNNIEIPTRKNAVECLELMLTASPEYFQNEEALNLWVHANTQWLKKKYGDTCFGAVLHLDETTPHIHAYVLPPLNSKGKLAAGDLINADYLTNFQDSYHDGVKDLGLQRGVKKSKAKHTTIRQFYQKVNEAEKVAENIKIPPPIKIEVVDKQNSTLLKTKTKTVNAWSENKVRVLVEESQKQIAVNMKLMSDLNKHRTERKKFSQIQILESKIDKNYYAAEAAKRALWQVREESMKKEASLKEQLESEKVRSNERQYLIGQLQYQLAQTELELTSMKKKRIQQNGLDITKNY